MIWAHRTDRWIDTQQQQQQQHNNMQVLLYTRIFNGIFIVLIILSYFDLKLYSLFILSTTPHM